MLIDSIAAFLALALLIYCLLAGADFGAGILESFRGREHREEQSELISHAMGPVWEANHVWLVLAVVILFNGFPRAFSDICIRFHIPLTIMLIGVILRGCAFTFRHYDAVKDRSQKYYELIFRISSLLTPVMLGVVAGAILLGKGPAPGDSFWDTYVAPWLNPFSFSVGIFAVLLFSFLAAVYLVGETKKSALREIFSRRARMINMVAVVWGAVVFAAAQGEGLSLPRLFGSKPASLICMIAATFLLWPLWVSLHRHRVAVSRLLAAALVSLVLCGWFAIQFPALMVIQRNEMNVDILSIQSAAASDATLMALLVALVAGCLIIFPSLFILLRIFKRAR